MQAFNEVINEVIVEWGIEFINNRREDARSLPKASGAGAQSFDHEVIKAGSNDLARALFEFEAHLRLLDMRRINWRQQPPTDRIEEWIKEIGIDKFKAGFERRYSLPKSDTRLLNQIAWGIVTKKAKTSKRKRHKWYNKSKERDIARLYGRLLSEITDKQLSNIKNALQS